jgi:hypothetical protein
VAISPQGSVSQCKSVKQESVHRSDMRRLSHRELQSCKTVSAFDMFATVHLSMNSHSRASEHGWIGQYAIHEIPKAISIGQPGHMQFISLDFLWQGQSDSYARSWPLKSRWPRGRSAHFEINVNKKEQGPISSRCAFLSVSEQDDLQPTTFLGKYSKRKKKPSFQGATSENSIKPHSRDYQSEIGDN